MFVVGIRGGWVRRRGDAAGRWCGGGGMVGGGGCGVGEGGGWEGMDGWMEGGQFKNMQDRFHSFWEHTYSTAF